MIHSYLKQRCKKERVFRIKDRFMTISKFRSLTMAALAAGMIVSAGAGLSVAAHAGKKGALPVVGGAKMYPTKNIVENAVNSKVHTTLVAAVKAAGLVETLSSPGPFTVFAPTDAAFAKLPAGTVGELVKPENKDKLTAILTYHVVAGRVTAWQIKKAITAGKGTASFDTVNGGKLMAKMDGKNVVLVDANGGMSTVTQANVMQSNGVIHVVDSVVLP
jgi:uncharacterized surface protein with fasciclin (FAS1) repeats